jgi:5-methyltetrahydropteroyltriglutamate--homocysteine methyltransferase
MIKINCIGYPRIGPKRELKNALEKYWKSEISEADLLKCANELKKIGKHKKIMV